MFMVTITSITGAIDTATITLSSTVTIDSTTAMINPTISSKSTMDSIIGVLE